MRKGKRFEQAQRSATFVCGQNGLGGRSCAQKDVSGTESGDGPLGRIVTDIASTIVPSVSFVPGGARPPRRSSTTVRLARRLGLTLVMVDDLTWTRRRHGKAFRYFKSDGAPLRSKAEIARLASLAVPPAYEDVRYAADPKAHLQAIGRDAAGRLQYRYHADWEKLREMRKARRLSRMVDTLPKVRRKVAQILAGREPTRDFALAAVIELIARTAIRPGSESYTKLHGTRGATTLLKSHVVIEGDCFVLSFRGKGGKHVRKECGAERLVHAISVLKALPGRRLFQYRDDAGEIRHVTAPQVNVFLRELAGTSISLKDFRTLLASAAVMDSLARVQPATSATARRKQVLTAIRETAEQLVNTPAICRRSYVHETVVTAFEQGVLEKFAQTLKSCRSPGAREKALAQVVAAASV
jgi:DNA topoisomerase-1